MVRDGIHREPVDRAPRCDTFFSYQCAPPPTSTGRKKLRLSASGSKETFELIDQMTGPKRYAVICFRYFMRCEAKNHASDSASLEIFNVCVEPCLLSLK